MIDDFIINTRTLEEHKDVCNRLFDHINSAKINCAEKKSKIRTKEVEYLGNTITMKYIQKRIEPKVLRINQNQPHFNNKHG